MRSLNATPSHITAHFGAERYAKREPCSPTGIIAHTLAVLPCAKIGVAAPTIVEEAHYRTPAYSAKVKEGERTSSRRAGGG